MTDFTGLNDMTDLEKLQALYQMEETVMERIERDEAFLADIRSAIAQLEGDMVQNPNWTEPNEYGARLLVPQQEIKAAFEKGSRAEQHWVHRYGGWHYDGIFATLTESVDPDVHRMYVEATAKHWSPGARLTLAAVYTEEGEKIPWHVIPWWANHGERGSTKIFEDLWAAPTRMASERGKAEEDTQRMDENYLFFQLTGRGTQFRQMFPYYRTQAEFDAGNTVPPYVRPS